MFVEGGGGGVGPEAEKEKEEVEVEEEEDVTVGPAVKTHNKDLIINKTKNKRVCELEADQIAQIQLTHLSRQ